MRVLALFAAFILVAGCWAAGPSPSATPPGVSAVPAASAEGSAVAAPSVEEATRDERYVPIGRIALADDDRSMKIWFTGAKPFNPGDPCSADYDARTAVVDGVLEVGVFQSRPPRPAVPPPCDAIGIDRTIIVGLDQPFSGIAWRDLFGPYLHFLAPPPGLVELTGLPAGWALVSERDVEESPTGRWARMYGPPDAPPDDETRAVVLYQSFDGPVGVTGGTEERQVMVDGKPATLYSSPESDELVLAWSLGTDGLAMVAYEPAFTAETLVKLAESARPADE